MTLNPALEAVRRTRVWYEARGKEEDFRTFEAFVLRMNEARTYEELADELGVPAPVVRARVTRVRERIREELRGLMEDSGKP
jgi:DNA-directed RNA polymerase specialized sigma24 family protein